jgi:hypothetical protein
MTKQLNPSDRPMSTKSKPVSTESKPVSTESKLVKPIRPIVSMEQLEELKNLTDGRPSVFQAIGVLKGKFKSEMLVDNAGEKYLQIYITVEDKDYKVITIGTTRRKKLKEIADTGEEYYATVYPKYLLIPRQPPEVIFCVKYWDKELKEDTFKFQPNTFVLRGCWQFIPQSRTPVVYIYRNYDARERLPEFLKADYNFRASIVPLVWNNAVVKPFRFNANKEAIQIPRYFIEVEANFREGMFYFSKLLKKPTDTLPRYLMSRAKMDRHYKAKKAKTSNTQTKTEQGGDVKVVKPMIVKKKKSDV